MSTGEILLRSKLSILNSVTELLRENQNISKNINIKFNTENLSKLACYTSGD